MRRRPSARLLAKRYLDRDPFLDLLRAFVPREGTDYKALCLRLPPGKGVGEHSHPEWTVLYYVNPCSPILIEKVPYQPEVGEVLVLEPDLRHSVAVNESDEDRITLALLVKDGP